MAPRFFVDAHYTSKSTIVLPEKQAHHASRVLRMREGDTAILFDGKGHEANVIMHFFSDRTEAEVMSVQNSSTESPLKTILIQSLVCQEKLDWILEKATELGVTEIVITPANRSVTKLDTKRLEKRLDQWQKTVASACEQCGRSYFPNVTWQPKLEVALRNIDAARKVILAPGAQTKFSLSKLDSICFAIGPEGGFSEEEIQLAIDLGYEACLLGPRVLRTETAGLTALSIAQWESGDFH